MMARIWLLGCVLAVDVPLPERAQPKEEAHEAVAATVNGDPIDRREVERELTIALGDRSVPPEVRHQLLRQTLEQLINRRLVLSWLAQTKQAASPADVELARQQLLTRLTQQGISLEQYLHDRQLDDESLRRSLSWQIGWERFLAKHQTDANLERYFANHRRDLDGTQIRVAQILFRVSPAGDAERLAAAHAKARQLLAQIRAGTISFADAARRHSESPSRDQGGDIGLIRRHEPMPEPFSRAAFALEPQQISEPVVTPIGVHLIQCLEIQPGQKSWREVRADVEQAATQYLFQWAADQARPQARIDYSRDFPKP